MRTEWSEKNCGNVSLSFYPPRRVQPPPLPPRTNPPSSPRPRSSPIAPPKIFEPNLQPSSQFDGFATWPSKPTLAFAAKLMNKGEQTAFTPWATSGMCDPTFAHLRPQSHESEAPSAPPIVHKEAAAHVPPKMVPLYKELPVNTSAEDAPNTSALTECSDPVVSPPINTRHNIESNKSGTTMARDPRRLPSMPISHSRGWRTT